MENASGIERAAAIRLGGGNPKIRSLDQALYRFDNKTFETKGMRGRIYAKAGVTLDPKKHLPILKDPKPHTQPQDARNVLVPVDLNVAIASEPATTLSFCVPREIETNTTSTNSPSSLTSTFDSISLLGSSSSEHPSSSVLS